MPRLRVEDVEVLERIRELVIQPGWENVWICPYLLGHIQAVGTDAAGRRQYIYHQLCGERADQGKFDELPDSIVNSRRLKSRLWPS
jgi:DNA topoisomerase IB